MEFSLGLPGRIRLTKKPLDGPDGGGERKANSISGLAWAEGLGTDLGIFTWELVQ